MRSIRRVPVIVWVALVGFALAVLLPPAPGNTCRQAFAVWVWGTSLVGALAWWAARSWLARGFARAVGGLSAALVAAAFALGSGDGCWAVCELVSNGVISWWSAFLVGCWCTAPSLF